MNRAATIKQDEIKRVVKAAMSAGLMVARVEVDTINGKVVVIAQGASDDTENPCDRLLR
ncbi:hypothetical protein [Rhodovulum strictum]|uniref:hypothetical protein n=1 Tax=Rhodovulum strictum TaxID=58314 RepID=UPI0014791F8A|nr:hypothetical protein [Rhodovulum strictum]